MKKNNFIYKKVCCIGILGIVIIFCFSFMACGKRTVQSSIVKEKNIKKDETQEKTEEIVDYIVDTVKDKNESIIIKQNSTILYGKDLWEQFLDNIQNNKKSHICIYFTENEYSIGNYIDLTYDGETFIVKKYKSEEEQKYKYIHCFEPTKKTGKMFVLMNEKEITYEEYERRMADAMLQNAPEECVLFTIND